jgi:hypothetical protein
MKNNLKAYSLIHFSVLFCFILSIYSTAIFSSDQRLLPGTSGSNENYYSIASPNLFFPLTKSENIVYGSGSFSNYSEKQTHNEFSFYCKEAEVLLFCSFLVHLNFSKRFVLPFKTTDIIYPFNYFW